MEETPHTQYTASFEDIPPEIELHVFGFLPPKALGRAECVCSQWRGLLKSDKTLQRCKRRGKGRVGVVNVKQQPRLIWQRGYGHGSLNSPRGVAVSGINGNIIVADTNNHCIQVFSSDGTFVNKWGTQGNEDGQFNEPCAVAVDEDGNIIVTDTENGSIQVFSDNGTFLKKWGTKGKEEGQLDGPYGVTVDQNGNVIVADHWNYRIQVFSNEGIFLRKWGGDWDKLGRQDYDITPYGVAVDQNDNVIVLERNGCIRVFSSEGVFLRMSKTGSWGEGVYGIAVDKEGKILTTTTDKSRIKVISNDGDLLTTWDMRGGGDGQFYQPHGIAVDGEGNIVVADTGNHRIQVFTTKDETK